MRKKDYTLRWAFLTLVAFFAFGLMATAEKQETGKSRKKEKILMVVTSQQTFPGTEEKTGLWLEEFATPFRVFTNAGYSVTIASPEGGKVPVDPRSTTPETKPENFDEAMALLDSSMPLEKVDLSDYKAVFFSGGHGTMFDFPNNKPVQKTIETFWQSDRPVALICHGPAALVGAKTEDGTPLVKGRRITAFTDKEEAAVDLVDKVPFLLESRLKELGATVETAKKFAEHVVVDGRLITGQNPASSAKAAGKLIDQIQMSD